MRHVSRLATKRVRAVFSQLTGALVRAILVALVISMPALLLPGSTSDANQVVVLIALFAAVLTAMEYSSSYPSLVEFRDAPPFNRIRFTSLFMMILLLSLVMRGMSEPTTLTRFTTAVGTLIGTAMDFPFSPVRLFIVSLPNDATAVEVGLVRTAAGVCYLISLVGLAIFTITLRLKRWPARNGSFNVWINLPTFDPTAGGDVVERLTRDARLNVVLGFLLPFIIPALLEAASDLFGQVSLASHQSLIWTISAWAFLPASLFMRGIAMARIAHMIDEKRQSMVGQEDGLLPV